MAFTWKRLSCTWKRLSGLGNLALMAGLTLPAPAHAQFFNWGVQPQPYEAQVTMPVEVIYQRIARQGYRVVRPLERNGRVLIADVIDRRGREVHLVIDARDGGILQSFANTGRPQLSPPGLIPGARTPARQAREPSRAKPARQTTASSPDPKEHSAQPDKKPSRLPSQMPSVPGQAEKAAPANPVANSVASPVEKPVAPTAKAVEPAINGKKPGFANGVPINPLD